MALSSGGISFSRRGSRTRSPSVVNGATSARSPSPTLRAYEDDGVSVFAERIERVQQDATSKDVELIHARVRRSPSSIR
jgi:hypothetical protein